MGLCSHADMIIDRHGPTVLPPRLDCLPRCRVAEPHLQLLAIIAMDISFAPSLNLIPIGHCLYAPVALLYDSPGGQHLSTPGASWRSNGPTPAFKRVTRDFLFITGDTIAHFRGKVVCLKSVPLIYVLLFLMNRFY